MNDLHHSKAYANHPEYDNMSGRVTYEGSIIGMTRDGYKVARTVTYISLGRADYGDAADPDAMIEHIESIPHVPLHPRRVPKSDGGPPINATQERIAGLLVRCGPMTGPQLAYELGLVVSGVHKHIRAREGHVYCRCGHRGKGVLWGLVGIHDQGAA